MMNDNWKNLIVKICAICDLCEDGHLNSYGESFYATHKMFDDIKGALHEFPDQIQEIYFGARHIGFVPSGEIRKAEIELLKPVKTAKDAARQIKVLMADIADITKVIVDADDTTAGENDLAASIARDVQHKLYFIQNFLS